MFVIMRSLQSKQKTEDRHVEVTCVCVTHGCEERNPKPLPSDLSVSVDQCRTERTSMSYNNIANRGVVNQRRGPKKRNVHLKILLYFSLMQNSWSFSTFLMLGVSVCRFDF